MIALELSVEETQILLAGLTKLPYEVVAGLIENIKSQAQPQVQPSEPVTE